MEFDKEEIEKILDEVISRFLIPKFRELGMRASGEWEENVHARGNEIWGRSYTEYLAEGRPPNKDQDPEAMHKWVGWAGSTFLEDWVQNKGLSINPYAVAYKIAREGTNWYPNGSDLLKVLESKEVIDYINSRLSILVIRDVKLAFNRYVKELV